MGQLVGKFMGLVGIFPTSLYVKRSPAERSIEMQKNLCVVFTDYEKVFDRVKQHEIIKGLEQIGGDQKDRRLLETLYWEQIATVPTDDDLSEWTSIKRGVRQGHFYPLNCFTVYRVDYEESYRREV